MATAPLRQQKYKKEVEEDLAVSFPRLGKHAHCLICGEANLTPLISLEEGLPHGEPSHEIGYSYQEITACGSCKHGQLEYHSHDCWTHEEPWEQYWWYGFGPSDVKILQELLKLCMQPLNPKCDCCVHQQVRSAKRGVYSDIGHTVYDEPVERFCWLVVDIAAGNLSFHVDATKAAGVVVK